MENFSQAKPSFPMGKARKFKYSSICDAYEQKNVEIKKSIHYLKMKQKFNNENAVKLKMEVHKKMTTICNLLLQREFEFCSQIDSFYIRENEVLDRHLSDLQQKLGSCEYIMNTLPYTKRGPAQIDFPIIVPKKIHVLQFEAANGALEEAVQSFGQVDILCTINAPVMENLDQIDSASLPSTSKQIRVEDLEELNKQLQSINMIGEKPLSSTDSFEVLGKSAADTDVLSYASDVGISGGKPCNEERMEIASNSKQASNFAFVSEWLQKNDETAIKDKSSSRCESADSNTSTFTYVHDGLEKWKLFVQNPACSSSPTDANQSHSKPNNGNQSSANENHKDEAQQLTSTKFIKSLIESLLDQSLIQPCDAMGYYYKFSSMVDGTKSGTCPTQSPYINPMPEKMQAALQTEDAIRKMFKSYFSDEDMNSWLSSASTN